MKKKIIITTGGTGGHLYPAQCLAKELLAHEIAEDILFVGGGLSKNRYFEKEEFAFKDIPCATFSLKNPLAVIRGSAKIAQGVLLSKKILKKFSPDLVIGFGSFYTLPMLIATSLGRIPFFLHEQNAHPGKVNRLFSPLALGTALTFPEAAHYLRGNAFLTALPLKKENCSADPYVYFSLDPNKLTLLVFGGSQGANKINQLFLQACEEIHPLSLFQVIHLTGDTSQSSLARKVYEKNNIQAYVTEFEKNIDLAWKIADLAFQRAGAGSIYESIESETPALLIPYPFATDDHQTKNGLHFVEIVNGGKMIGESDASSKQIARLLLNMIQDREIYKQQIRSYKETNKRLPLIEIIQREGKKWTISTS